MLGDLWKRPSVIVVATCVAVLGTFVVRGDLALQGKSPVVVAEPSAAAPQTPAPAAPVVVKATKEARTQAASQQLWWRGRIYDTSGFLVMGAQLLAGGQLLTQSGPEGEFALQVAPELQPCLVQAPGYRPQWVMPALHGPDAQAVQLVPAAPWDQVAEPAAATTSLRGEGVVLAGDGRPLGGAYVTAVGTDRWVRTDEFGRYRLALPSRRPVLLVHQPDAQGDGSGLAARSESLDLPRDTGLVPLPDLTAVPGLALRGVLRDARGTPLSGVALQVRGEGLLRTVESGISGMFRLTGLLRGSYEVQPLGYRGQLGGKQRVMVDEQHGECDIQLVAVSERRLLVVDETGAPRPGAYVANSWAGERRSVAVADADGVVAVAAVNAASVWEVREGPSFVELRVQQFDDEAGRLVVALP